MKIGDKEHGKKVYLDMLNSVMWTNAIVRKRDLSRWGEREWKDAINEMLVDRDSTTDVFDLAMFFMSRAEPEEIMDMLTHGLPSVMAEDIMANLEANETPLLVMDARM